MDDTDYADDDELLDECFINEDQIYEQYRDDWCNALDDALKKVYEDFVKPAKHGYYSGCHEKFLEHSIQRLSALTQCTVQANDGRVIALAKMEG